MRQIVIRYWVLMGFAAVALILGACGLEETESVECERSAECDVGEVCHNNQCVLEEEVGEEPEPCLTHGECASYERCVDLFCQERTTCEDNSHCAPGNMCLRGNCVERECNSDADCTRGMAGGYCNDGLCQSTPHQCTAVGQECELGAATRSGFSCEDIGSGPTCYRKCTAYPFCHEDDFGNGTMGLRYDCSGGAACITDTALVSAPICSRSECGGFFRAEADCAEIVADAQADGLTTFDNGVHCAMGDAGVFTCQGAGLAVENAQCASTSDCGEGLVCVSELGPFESLGSSSFCARACNSDSMCDGDDSCIADDSGAYDGVGFCGPRCDPFNNFEEQCSENIACVAASRQDGMCFRPTTRQRGLYEPCGSTEQCPDNSQCVGLTQFESRCLPACDPTLGSAAQRDATCPPPTVEGYIQFAHLGGDVGEVDVLVDGETVATLDFGEATTDFVEVIAGIRAVEVRDALTSAVYFSDNLDIERTAAVTVAIVGDAISSSALTTLINDVQRNVGAAAASSRVRFAHGLAGVGEVDLAIVVEGGSINESADRRLLVEGLDYGATSNFSVVQLNLDGATSAEFDIYVLPANSADAAEAYAVAEGFSISGGDVLTIYAAGDLRPADEQDQIAAEIVGVAYASAPAGRKLGGYCYDLNGGSPTIGSGICLETCRNSDDWGGGCTHPNDACSPVGAGLGWCFPAGNGSVGSTCTDGDDCGENMHCDMGPNNEGTCRSLCQTNTQTNPNLGCESGEACIPMQDYANLGECRLPCNPGSNYADGANCPTGQSTCIGDSGAASCTPSGELALGADCGQPTTQNCAPGLACAQPGTTLGEVLLDPFSSLNTGQSATCTNYCVPFVEDSGCSEGFACSPVTPNGTGATMGHCVEALETPVASGLSCGEENIGKMCDNNSYCLASSSNACLETRGECLQLCDFNTGRGCTGGTSCIEGFQGGPLFGFLGICN